MKYFMAILLLLSSFVGVLTISEELCMEVSNVAAISSPSQHEVAHSSACHHEADGSCHQCHLGHCAFEVSSVSSPRFKRNDETSYIVPTVVVAMDTVPNLFRPPIC